MHISGHFSCPNNSPTTPIALNPAWNACVMNLIPFEPVPEGSSPEIREANARKMTFTKNQALKDIAPDSGAYFNEVCILHTQNHPSQSSHPHPHLLPSSHLSFLPSQLTTHQCDINDPSWKQSIFGPNYEKLLSIKRLYDPNGLLYCRNCVGSDQWVEQGDGTLCQSKVWEMAEPGDGDDDELF